MLVLIYPTVRCQIPEDRNLNINSHENSEPDIGFIHILLNSNTLVTFPSYLRVVPQQSLFAKKVSLACYIYCPPLLLYSIILKIIGEVYKI
jgi:hypothetical protein